MKKLYIVRLDKEEREHLNSIIKSSRMAAYKRTNAQILLKADVGEFGSGWNDKTIAEAFDVCTRTVERVRERLCTQGLQAAIERAKGSGKKRKLDGVQEAQLIALACTKPPKGYARWSLRLLADRFVQLKYIDAISHEAVRRTLKKTN